MTNINWKDISTTPHNRFVLVACKSGYVMLEWIYRVAQFYPSYRDDWIDEGDQRMTDSGHVPLYWCELPNEPV